MLLQNNKMMSKEHLHVVVMGTTGIKDTHKPPCMSQLLQLHVVSQANVAKFSNIELG